jgi:hypothetical protein
MRAAEWVINFSTANTNPQEETYAHILVANCQQPCHKSTTLMNLYGEVTQL